MKDKKLFLPKVIMLAGILVAAVLNVLLCIAKKPAIAEYRFPFSITYEFGGTLYTVEDEFVCTFDGPGATSGRFYSGAYANAVPGTESGDYLIQTYEDGELVIYTNLFAGYQMGDPQYADHYTEYHRCEPYVAFYSYEDYVGYEDEATLAPYNVRIVSWEYPEPLENKFVFAKFTRLPRASSLAMTAVSLLVLLACVFLVKREKGLVLGVLDKLTVVTNLLIFGVVYPFLAVIGVFVDINGNASDPLSIATFFVPAITGYGLAASVSLRRKGYRKASFAVQFVGIAAMALILGIEQLLWALA